MTLTELREKYPEIEDYISQDGTDYEYLRIYELKENVDNPNLMADLVGFEGYVFMPYTITYRVEDIDEDIDEETLKLVKSRYQLKDMNKNNFLEDTR